jgi:RimJ/RimL family protein N-acetyltransferase
LNASPRIRYRVFRRDLAKPAAATYSMPDGYTMAAWKPSTFHMVPSALAFRWKFRLLSTMFFLLGRGARYRVFAIFAPDGSVAHYSIVHPKWFRFPFMGEDHLQIGGLWTEPRHRGRGLATYAVQSILRAEKLPDRVYWYVAAEDNPASIRVAEKNGFAMHGFAASVKRFGGLLTRFELTDVSG